MPGESRPQGIRHLLPGVHLHTHAQRPIPAAPAWASSAVRSSVGKCGTWASHASLQPDPDREGCPTETAGAGDDFGPAQIAPPAAAVVSPRKLGLCRCPREPQLRPRTRQPRLGPGCPARLEATWRHRMICGQASARPLGCATDATCITRALDLSPHEMTTDIAGIPYALCMTLSESEAGWKNIV